MTPKQPAQVEDLRATVQALFPGAPVAYGRLAGDAEGFRLVPGPRRPRLLVAADAPHAAVGAVDRPSANDTTRQAALRRVAAKVLRAPHLAAAVMPRGLAVGRSAEESVSDYLAEVVGGEVRISLAIGSRRANRKPVLNVHRVDGTEVGYAKVGLTDLANELIDHEAAVLADLERDRPARFVAPRLLHHGRWRGSSVVLMESLRPAGPPAAHGVPLDAVAELTARGGLDRQRLADTDWLTRITAEGAGHAGNEHAAADNGGAADGGSGQVDAEPELVELARRYRDQLGDVDLPVGRWHGDLGPWNMAWQGRTPMIWDWERCAAGVPAGIDAVHFTCHQALRAVGDLPRARAALTGAGAAALRGVLARLPGGGPPSDRLVQALVAGYLLAIAARFTADARRPGGDAVGRLARWHLGVLRDRLDEERDRRDGERDRRDEKRERRDEEEVHRWS